MAAYKWFGFIQYMYSMLQMCNQTTYSVPFHLLALDQLLCNIHCIEGKFKHASVEAMVHISINLKLCTSKASFIVV